jgi:hypothetical protein
VLVLRSVPAGMAVVACAMLVSMLWDNVRAAQAELEDPGHRQVCARG